MDELPSKLHVKPEQLYVKLAVGPGGGGGGGGGGGAPPPINAVYSNRLGVPDGSPVIFPLVAFVVSAEPTCAGVAAVFTDRYSAAPPATWGAAIDVPLIVLMASLLVFHDDVIDDPGALMSTQLP